MLTNVIEAAYGDGMAMLVVPPGELPPGRFRDTLASRMAPMDDLFVNDRLFLPGFASVRENSRPNVFKPAEGTDSVEAFEAVARRRGNRGMLGVLSVEVQLPFLENDQLRRLRFREGENVSREDATSVPCSTQRQSIRPSRPHTATRPGRQCGRGRAKAAPST
jgi:hypothetical protein